MTVLTALCQTCLGQHLVRNRKWDRFRAPEDPGAEQVARAAFARKHGPELKTCPDCQPVKAKRHWRPRR